MDEQRVREIVREELAELIKSIQPSNITIIHTIEDSDALLDRLSNDIASRMSKSMRPEQPWG